MVMCTDRLCIFSFWYRSMGFTFNNNFTLFICFPSFLNHLYSSNRTVCSQRIESFVCCQKIKIYAYTIVLFCTNCEIWDETYPLNMFIPHVYDGQMVSRMLGPLSIKSQKHIHQDLFPTGQMPKLTNSSD